MARYWVEVDVATRRPPRADRTIYVVLEARGWIEARCTAALMAFVTTDAAMPVATRHGLIQEGYPEDGYECD